MLDNLLRRLRRFAFKRWGGIEFTVEGMTRHGFKSSFLPWQLVEDHEWTGDRRVFTIWLREINGIPSDRPIACYELERSDVEPDTWENLLFLYQPPR